MVGAVEDDVGVVVGGRCGNDGNIDDPARLSQEKVGTCSTIDQ